MDDKTTDTSPSDKEYPEGGWGWVVCAASFMAWFIVFGVHNCFGIIYSSLINELNMGKAESAWVGSMAGSLNFLCGPLASYLCKRYGCRPIALLGSFLSVLGLFLTSFVKEPSKMYLTYGLLWGVGSGMSFVPTLIVLGQYFHRRFPIAVGIVSSGSGVGGLLSAPFINFLLKKIKWKNSLRVISGCALLLFVCGLLYRPRNIPQHRREENEERKRSDRGSCYVSLLRCKPFLAVVFSAALFQLCYTVPYIHLFEFSQTVGISSSKGSWLLGILSISSTVGKVIFGQVSQLQCFKTKRIYLLQFAFFVMGLATALCTLGSNYAGLLAYVLVYGIFDGCFVSQLPVIISDTIGHSRLTEGLGILYGAMAVPMSFGPPIAGWLYQAFGDYNGAFYVAGGSAIITSMIFFAVPCLQHRQKLVREPELNDVTQDDVTHDDVTQNLVTQGNVTFDRPVLYTRYLKSGSVINIYAPARKTAREEALKSSCDGSHAVRESTL